MCHTMTSRNGRYVLPGVIRVTIGIEREKCVEEKRYGWQSVKLRPTFSLRLFLPFDDHGEMLPLALYHV
jgi:hypothetical protein